MEKFAFHMSRLEEAKMISDPETHVKEKIVNLILHKRNSFVGFHRYEN